MVYEERPELAIVALLYMLGRFPWTRCPRTAEAIVRHLRLVAEDDRYEPAFRDAAGRICDEWENALERVTAERSIH
jgi:hypothetical protein